MKSKDEDPKNKGKMVLNITQVEDLLELEHVDSKLCLIVREAKMATKANLEV